MNFTKELLEVTEPIWATIIDQPMVVEIGAGTLERNPIRYWVKQVYVALLKPFIDDRFQQFC